ncbi:MAG: serine hydrolase [Patescibacteria group bacterium]
MKVRVLAVIGIFFIGAAAGFLISRSFATPQQIQANGDSTAYQVRQGGYKLINPLLECEIGEKTLTKEYISFKYKVEREIAKLKAQGTVAGIAVYFRDLNNGLGFGVNQTLEFSPASLLKIPVMMAYFKAQEADPKLFSQKYEYTGLRDLDEMENIKPSQSMEAGKEYSVEDLLYRMIVFSDNNAMALLVENLPLSIQDRVYKDLGITIPGVRGTEDYMTVADNASFLRILYNASYLSKNDSEKALSLLTKVDFAEGIRAGVPKTAIVANKFGERVYNGQYQLHDCGIVYLKNHPYLLCMMSRGNDLKKLASSLTTISGIVYTEARRQTNNR